MNDKTLFVYMDYICWMVLIASIWAGPQWVEKLALTIMCLWNMAIIARLSK